MAVSLVAAAAFHWFGVDYAAGDPVDTTGWSARAVAQLVKGAPVVASSSGGSTPVFGSVQFVTSGPLFGPEQTFVIDTTNGAQVTLVWGPVTLPAGGHVVAKMGLVIVSEGGPTFALAAGTAEIVVTNLAGTEKLGVENASTDVTSLTAVPWDAGAIDEQIGSDLSVDGVTPSRILSAAGGQFIVSATFSPTYTSV